MEVMIQPSAKGKESDDRAILQCAEDYGAIILSGDKFKNHPDFRDTTNKYLVRFEREKCEITNDITNKFPIECKYVFHMDGSKNSPLSKENINFCFKF